MSTTIIIADDHRIFRQGLFVLLQERSGWEVVGEAGSGEEAVQLASTLSPDIAVIDVEMPGMGGIEATRRIREVSVDTRVIALSMYADEYYRERMRKAGASAYVLKNEAIDQLVEAIDAVLRGQTYTPPTWVRNATAAQQRSARVDSEQLSAREQEVLRLLAAGKGTTEIAELLAISPKTVETYRSRLMNKLAIDNLSGLVRFAIRAGLVSPEE
jgi:DNA-binding NarL/FixJ family response regulator